MSEINYNSQQSANVINQRKLVNGKWMKICCAVLALLCTGNLMAGQVQSTSYGKNFLSNNSRFSDQHAWPLLINSIIDAGCTNIKSLNEKELARTKSLIEKEGANINETNKYRETPLMFAAEFGLREIVELLLQHKAQVNAQQQNGDTALMYALRPTIRIKTEEQILETVKLLLSYKANINIKNKRGQFSPHLPPARS